MVALFGDAIAAKFLPTEWPDAVVLDALPLNLRSARASGQPSQGSKTGVMVMGAYGYRAGSGKGEIWKLGVRGGEDQVEWEDFLRSMPTVQPPTWVVCDRVGATSAAARADWPSATIYICEDHLRRLLIEKLDEDGFFRGSKLYAMANSAFANQRGWDKWKIALAAEHAPEAANWTKKHEKLMARQFAVYQPGRPRSTGGIETPLDAIRRRIGKRHYVFRNRARLERLLNLMAVELRGEASEIRFAEVIRQTPTVRRRAKSDRRRLDDHGGSSLKAMVAAVEARLGPKRAAKAAYQRGLYAATKAKKLAAQTPAGPSAPPAGQVP